STETAAREAFEAMARDDPGDIHARANLATVHGILARIHEARGHWAAAVADHRQRIAVLERVLQDRPGPTSARAEPSEAHAYLGDLHSNFDRWEPSVSEYEASIRLSLGLIRDDPKALSPRDFLARVASNLALIRLAQGRLDRAAAAYRG